MFANRSLELRWKTPAITLRPRPVRKPTDEGNDIGALPNPRVREDSVSTERRSTRKASGLGGGKGSLGHTGGFISRTTGRVNFPRFCRLCPPQPGRPLGEEPQSSPS